MSTTGREAVLLALIAVAVFVTQPRKVGFERGHHGWVSSHSLAIIVHATRENGFVGYAARLQNRDGRVEHGYFDRYPVLFSALSHAVLSRTSDGLESYVQHARLWMDLVYVLTIAGAYCTLHLLLERRVLALGAVLFAMSGWYFVHFKDMVHFDQPALLGLTGLFYGLAVLRLRSRSAPLYAGAIVAPLLGRGYASVVMLIAWTAIAAIEAGVHRLRTHAMQNGSGLRPLLTASGLAIAVAGLALVYNVAVESRRTGAAWSETSIVASATSRLRGSEAFDRHHARVLAWPGYLSEQARRLRRGATPAPLIALQDRLDAAADAHAGVAARAFRAGRETLRVLFQIGFGVLGIVALHALVRQTSPPARAVYLSMALGGIAWLLVMRRLAAFHEYASMYHLGFYLALFALVAQSLPAARHRAFALVSGAVFAAALLVNAWTESAVGRTTEALTIDFDRIERRLSEREARVWVGDRDAYYGFVDGAPFALGFYGRRYLFVLDPAEADYVLERRDDDARPRARLRPIEPRGAVRVRGADSRTGPASVL